MKRADNIAFGGMLAALSTAILFFSSLIPGYAIAAAAAAGIVPAAAVVRRDLKTGTGVYLITALLGLLLLPRKTAAIWYLTLFGYYGMAKSILERQRQIVEWCGKLALYTVVFLLLRFVLQFVAMPELPKFGTVVLYGIGLLCFILYDLGFSRLIGLYLVRIHRKTGKGE